MHRILSATIGAMLAVPAVAADPEPALTIYRSDGGALFEGGGSPISDGYAIVHERRPVQLNGGRQTLVVSGLPSTLDAEAVAVELGSGARVLAQRVLAAGDAGLLAAHRGERVDVYGNDKLLVSGVLLSIDGNGIGVRGDDGRVNYVREYSNVRFAEGSGLPGSTLQLSVDGAAGTQLAKLTYPTSGLGWRAAYSALIGSANACSLRLESLASIANRSGRDYPASRLKLVAGQPNFAKNSGPQPMMMMAKTMSIESADEMPQQNSLGDYRSFTIDGSLELPDGSVTQVPLYAARDIACQRSWVFDNGSAWFPPKPMLGANNGPGRSSGPISSRLRFTANENMPAGYLRVLTRDRDGQLEFLGENRIGDTAKGQAIDVTLGTAFELNATRERTAFSVDRAARQMTESFRITLENSGDSARQVTVREYPNRWNQWKLSNSSVAPTRQTPDQLEFVINVPAGGKTTLDLSLAYQWTANDD
jgi:hypothetical protein